MSHSTGSSCLPSDGLDTPVVLADLGGGVPTRRARLLLNVEAALAATDAERVRLVVPLSERPGSLADLTHGVGAYVKCRSPRPRALAFVKLREPGPQLPNLRRTSLLHEASVR